MPLAANALTTLGEAKRYLKLPLDETDEDSLIESLINAASQQIEAYTGRQLKKTDYVDEEYDGSGSRHIVLKASPVVSVTSVYVDDELVPADEYKVRKKVGAIARISPLPYGFASSWRRGILNVRVTYSAGYDPIPHDLELACKHLVMFYYKTDIADFSRTYGEGFVLRAEAMPRQVQILLDPYKRVG